MSIPEDDPIYIPAIDYTLEDFFNDEDDDFVAQPKKAGAAAAPGGKPGKAAK